MRHALKRDSSHRSIADALIAVCGAENVIELFDFDIACRFNNKGWIVECKDESYSKAKRTGGFRKGSVRLKQQKLKAIFGDQFVFAYTPEQALTAIGAIQRLPESNEWEIAK